MLVADDDPSTLDVVTTALKLDGYDVLVATDGPSALRVAFERTPDIILLDVVMPGMSGIEVCERLERDPRARNIPVLMVTGSTATSDKLLAFTAGADDYIVKPFDPVELLARVRSTLRRTRRMRGVNPLTHLPGNVEISDELAVRIAAGQRFALMHVDLDSFKEFNDYYGFVRGDRAIKTLAGCMREAVRAGDPPGFIGHIGGDDFVAIVDAPMAEPVARLIIDKWDSVVTGLYDRAELDAGYIQIHNRRGELVHVPLMTVSIGIATNAHRPIYSHLDAAETASELKSYVKRKAGSNYAIDRRQLAIALD